MPPIKPSARSASWRSLGRGRPATLGPPGRAPLRTPGHSPRVWGKLREDSRRPQYLWNDRPPPPVCGRAEKTCGVEQLRKSPPSAADFWRASRVLELAPVTLGAPREHPPRTRAWGTRPPEPLGFAAFGHRQPLGKPACPPRYGAAGGPKAENPAGARCAGAGAKPPHACPPRVGPEPQELGTSPIHRWRLLM